LLECRECSILQGTVASLRWTISICQLHITFLMLLTKNYKRAFEFGKVIIWNTVSFFDLGYSKNGIFDDVIITSAVYSDIVI